MTLRNRRRKLSHEVSEEILVMIENGEVSIGGQLPTENELVELFSVTFVTGGRPGPLRTLPGHTREIHKSDLLDILEFRRIFEPETAALAAERATDKDLEEMHRCVVELDKGVAAGIRPPEDLGFHLALARATRNSAVVDVSSLIIRFYEQDVYMPDALDVEGHRAIYEAVKNRNPDVARKAMCDHLEEIERRYGDQ
jgi:GntR family transcriptional repressor for pyruvate dehydrogenase complex